MKDGETIKELKANLKKANNELKERSLLLDMYKTVTKEVRDKVGLMAAEKKVRGELRDRATLSLLSVVIYFHRHPEIEPSHHHHQCKMQHKHYQPWQTEALGVYENRL